MLYIKPNYFSKFKCIADQCEATCCAGWQIVIDEEALVRYRKEQSVYGEVLRTRVDWEEGVFKQDAYKRCAFLNTDNLCDMYNHLGEQSLCMTCTNYPRHIEEFENIREITLAISCPEAARIILGQTEPVTFKEEEIEGEEEAFEDFDPFFFSYLEDGRNIALKILQNREWDISVRYALIKSFAEEMQEIIQNEALYELVDVFEKYEDEKFLANAIHSIQKEIATFHAKAGDAFRYSKTMFGKLYELEHLSEEWEPYLERCWEVLYGEKAAEYQNMHEAFRTWAGQFWAERPRSIEEGQSGCRKDILGSSPDYSLDIILEQLLVYFVFTYFCGAVYDDNVLGKVNLALVSVYNLYEMLVAKWTEQGHRLERKDIERIVYRYSRELEHSDENLERMERMY